MTGATVEDLEMKLEKKMNRKERVVRSIIAIILLLVYTLTFLFIEERYLGGTYITDAGKKSRIRELFYYGTTYLLYKVTSNYIIEKLKEKGLLH